MKIAVIGEGAWGTAIATLLAHNNHEVLLWCHDAAVKDSILNERINKRYLPEIMLPANIVPHTDLDQVLCEVEWIFEAIPVKFLRSIIEKAVSCERTDQKWVILSKGIEQDSLLLPSQIIDQVFKRNVPKAAVLGPSYALPLARKETTAVTVAASDCHLGRQVQKLMATDYFRPYLSLDLMGVQLGGALKNVIALAIGMMDGHGYSDNAKVFLLTRGLHEMVQLALAMGGRQETMYGLSGVGDLVLTAMGSLSRNREVGKRLGQGESLQEILRKTGYTPEGINTVQSVHQLIQKKNLKLPILSGMYAVIFEGKTLDDLIQELMDKPLEDECAL